MDKRTLLLLLTIISLRWGNCIEDRNTFQIFSGFHFEKLTDKIPYESTIPLLFTSQLMDTPKFDNFNDSLKLCLDNTTHPKTFCEFYNTLVSLQELITNEITTQFSNSVTNLTLDFNNSKKRRGLTFLEQFFTWCCNLASTKQVSGLFENQKDLQTHTNEIINSVGSQYKDMVNTVQNLNNFSHNVNQMSDKVHKSLYLVQDELNSLRTTSYVSTLKQSYLLTQQTWTYMLYNYYLDKYREILTNCNLNKLSEQLLPPKNLSMHLTDLIIRAKAKGLTLAIQRKNLHLYYELKITTCRIFNNTLLVRVDIPLITNDLRGEMFKSIATPLLWDNQICMHNLEDKYIFQTKDYTKVITDLETCNENTFPLCLLPRQTLIAMKEQLCLHLVLNSESIDNLQKHCHFICDSAPKYPIVSRLLPNKYLITNIIEQLTINCESDLETHVIKPISTGTLKVDIPCNCELLQGNIVLLTKLKPCDSKDTDVPHIINLIPATWSKLKTLKLFPLSSGIKHEFNNLSEILDSNWTLNTPTFQVTALKKIEAIKLPNESFDIFNNTEILFYILLAWTSVISIIVLLMIYFIHIQSIKINLMLPKKDYNRTTEQ